MAASDPSRVITGVCSPTDSFSWYNRLEIYDFVKPENYMQFSLYVQALRAMMDRPASDPLSYYQLASIHGAPYAPWKGSGGAASASSSFGGYCTHNTTLFPTWHRPYVALFEQTLQSQAVAIANGYTGAYKSLWMTAAVTLRQPYWDWALNPLPPPEVYKLPQVTITSTDGTQRNVDNPFLYYRFHPQDGRQDFPAQYATWNRTGRFTKLVNNIPQLVNGDPVEDIDALEKSNSSALNQKQGVFMMFTHCKKWEEIVDPKSDRCLEGIHNGIHMRFAGGMSRGQFYSNGAAAFDPVFWLHHAQTDRLFALWSAINPGVWVAASAAVHGGTYTMPVNSPLNESTELTPFYSTDTDTPSPSQPSRYWRSTELRGSLSFQPLLGYSYPDFDGVNRDTSSLSDITKKTMDRITQLYDPFPPRKVLQTPETASAEAAAITVLLWAAQVRVKQYALGLASIKVYVFVGPVPDEPNDWDTAPSFAGEYSTMINATMLRCANCVQQAEAGLVVGGAVYLNSSISKYGRAGGPGEASDAVNSLEPEDVIPLLEKELQWRVYTGSGPLVHPSSVDGLEVEVVATPMVWPADAMVPTYGEPLRYPEVTRGRPGGVQSME